jgi:hypothetical protein
MNKIAFLIVFAISISNITFSQNQKVGYKEGDDSLYLHGSTGTAIKRAKDTKMSVVQGHFHSKSFVEWVVSI